ncbi:hypothetical protein [Culturomica massiliensis]|uniref:hypothetical protein n=1 Tax=Culturomica massiliensis TaxID=1841857 RepID=UPI002670BE34|nr:hypothetical protein [Culturomica massiliensis]
MLHDNLPDDDLPKREWMQKGFSELMKLPDARQACSELLPEMPQMADTIQLMVFNTGIQEVTGEWKDFISGL